MCPAISSRKLGSSLEGQLKNAYLYNGKELFEDADLNWYDYGFRNYDPQIGRFPQLDPLAFEYAFYTPYQYAGCEPIANVDLDGLEPLNVIGKVGDAIVTGASVMSEVVVTSTKVARTAGITGKVATISAKVLLQVSNVAVNRSESTCVGCAEANRRMQMSMQNRAFTEGLNARSIEERVADGIRKAVNDPNKLQFTTNRSEQEKWAIAIDDTYGEALEYVPVIGDLHDLKDVITGLSQGDFVSASMSAFFLIPGTDFLKPVKSLVKKDKQLLKFAKETFKGNKELSKEATDLVDKYRKGLDGGKGGHPLQGKAFEGTGI